MYLGTYKFKYPVGGSGFQYSDWILIPQELVRQNLVRYQLNILAPCDAVLQSTINDQKLILENPKSPMILPVNWERGIVTDSTQSYSMKTSAVRIGIDGSGGEVSLNIAVD